MPNHITNKVTIEGSKADLKNLRNTIKGEKNEIIDFNKIIEMPADLQISSDGLVMFLENPFTMQEPASRLRERLIMADNDAVDNFVKAVKNLNQYGCTTWYNWSINNWGTKWNAYGHEDLGTDCFQFDTAWSTPTPVFERISKLFPKVKIVVEYADEDIGSNCGTNVFQNGSLVEQIEPEDSTAFALRIKRYDEE